MADFIEEIGHAFVGSPARTRTTDMVVNSNQFLPIYYVFTTSHNVSKCSKATISIENKSLTNGVLWYIRYNMKPHETNCYKMDSKGLIDHTRDHTETTRGAYEIQR